MVLSIYVKEFFYFRQFARLYRGASGCRLGNGMSDCRRYGGAGYPSHLSRIYPLTVISSLSPLLGLFGTIVGMIEAFGLVALFGDEGGASILSDSISKALITTAAGLVVAMPSIAVYFILKSRISNLGSQIEMGIESVVNAIYLNKKTE